MSIARACRLLGRSKQAWHKARREQAQAVEKNAEMEQKALAKVLEIRRDLPRTGGKKLYRMLQNEGERIGRDALFDLLREQKMLVKRRKKHRITTDSSNWARQHPDLVQGRAAQKPEEIWVADITYLETEKGDAFAHLVSDAYSKKLMGWEIAADLKAESTQKALKMAIGRRQYDAPVIFHSDRGVQYRSKLMVENVRSELGALSMTQNGSPYENAIAERINGILKDELGLGQTFKNLEHARAVMARADQLYNNQRLHWSCHLLTPNQMHDQHFLKTKTYRKPKTDPED